MKLDGYDAAIMIAGFWVLLFGMMQAIGGDGLECGKYKVEVAGYILTACGVVTLVSPIVRVGFKER